MKSEFVCRMKKLKLNGTDREERKKILIEVQVDLYAMIKGIYGGRAIKANHRHKRISRKGERKWKRKNLR
jgi:hypothetical protein